ncbi:hypothetical protein M378DRAFT_82158, partial [Amanita muscaria Koide BX008]
LTTKGVKCTSLDPVCMGYAGESSPPVIVWMGVVPGSISAKDGVDVATHCKRILSAHDIDDVHVEIRELEVIRSANPKMYKPDLQRHRPGPRAFLHFPWSPYLCRSYPSIQGTGGFFISDSRNPGKIYLVTARHVVFHLDNDSNELYQHRNSSQRPRNVLLFGDAAIEKHITAIESEIGGKHIIIEHLESWLENAEQSEIRSFLSWRRRVLVDISRDWKKWKNRVLGNVVPSPPIGFDVGEEGFTYTLAINSCISGTYL